MEQQRKDGMNHTPYDPVAEPAPAFSQVVDARGCVRVDGDLTGRTADQLRGTVAALRRGGLSGFVLDLRGLRSTDEAGLRSVETTRAAVEADGGRLTVLSPPETVPSTCRVDRPEQ